MKINTEHDIITPPVAAFLMIIPIIIMN